MQEFVTPNSENKIEHFFIRATTPNVLVSKEHSHREWEAIFVIEGTGITQIKGFPDIQLRPGTIVCIPPGTPHESIVNQPYRSITFRVSNYQFSPEKRPFHLMDNIQQDFRFLALLMLRLYVEDAAGNGNIIRHLIYCMLDYIRRNAGASHSDFTCVERIKQQICENFQDPNFDLTALIQKSGYSVNYFRDRFTKAVGMPPYSYLLEKRLEYAEELLRNDGDSVRISDVAQECGFTDPQYFSRIFKKRRGIAPSKIIGRPRGAE